MIIINWTEEEYAAFLQSKGVKVEKPKTNKYRAKRTNGHASKHEDNIASDLHARELAERIRVMEQVSFQLTGCNYIADFVILHPGGKYEVIDAKGVKTDVYKLKKRMMRELWEIEILEI